jgi:hypothetical protein
MRSIILRLASFVLVLCTACGGNSNNTADSGMAGMDASAQNDSAVAACEITGPENTLAACMDDCDNEGDGVADCDDSGCCAHRTDCPANTECGRPMNVDAGMPMACATVGPENTLAACMDGCDNDENSFADCNEFDCCGVRTDCPETTACGRRSDAGMPMPFTIEQLQNPEDPAHPEPGARVTIEEEGMVALSGRMLVGSSRGSGGSCRFAIWVGNPVSGDYTAIQVQELIRLPAGTTSCFDVAAGKISPDFAPGDAVTSIENATYSEFCAGPAGATPCTDFEQSNIFLGGTATITRGTAGTAPTPTTVTVAELVSENGAPGTRALALEGGLLRVENVRISSRTESAGSSTITLYSAYLADAPTIAVEIVVQNFVTTRCVRDELTRLAGGTDTATISGVLLPNFGRWSLRVRDEGDIAGLTCAPAPAP